MAFLEGSAATEGTPEFGFFDAQGNPNVQLIDIVLRLQIPDVEEAVERLSEIQQSSHRCMDLVITI